MNSDSRSIDSVCQRYESAWQAGEDPEIETFLEDWKEPERSELLNRLLILEFEHKHRDASTVVSEAFSPGTPEHANRATEIKDLDQIAPDRESTTRDEGEISLTSRMGELKPHAQGGLGLVYRANDQTLSRDVALKFIRPNLSNDVDSRERFRLEAVITSRLEHPGVVPVYGLGRTDKSELFYAMRFIQGETLDEAILRLHEADEKGELNSDDRERAMRQMLVQFVAVCKTIAYAHNRGILHRDIKPDNVMLGRYGETLVIDWGLAMPIARQGVFRDASEKTLMRDSGTGSSAIGCGGTPAFMSPEQASGTMNLTPATDIYSLGATLYKLIAGKSAFRGRFDDVSMDIIRGEFPRPTEIKKTASKTLEAICLKAMARKEEDRYLTALELAADVESYLGDSPVSAYREPTSKRMARWSRRHRTLSQALLVCLLLLTVAGSSAALIFGQLRSSAVDAQQQERVQREKSLSVSSRFAARTIANEVDTRLRLLERSADDPRFHKLLARVNSDPQNQALRKPLQEWLNRFGQEIEHIYSRAIYICAIDGSQVARYPQFTEDGQPASSLKKQFRYRDYFHGRGNDFEEGPPLDEAHVSIAMASTNDGTLSIGVSAPIIPSGRNESIGVLGMSIELGKFADLSISLPEGQKALLIDTRQYYMKPLDPDVKRGPRGEGLVLHHNDLGDLKGRSRLPHLDDATLAHLLENIDEDGYRDFENLLSDGYRDPVAPNDPGSWVAAFAPVELNARQTDSDVHDFGWYVIIQQKDL